jgi:tRNA(adenine34) deaminase
MQLNINYFQELKTLSKKALKNGDVPVSALVIDQKGEIIGRGYNQKFLTNNPFFHAEIIAIQNACLNIGDWRLENCHIYVTFQPCLMCLGAIIETRIKKITIGLFKNKKDSLFSQFEEILFTKKIQIFYNQKIDNLSFGLMKNFFKELRNNH